MKINADFSKTAIVDVAKQDWVASPMPGVDRKPLDRVGAEVARATSIVRYAPNSHFSPHVHSGGEEFVVLQGVFQDEHGDYPAGSYVRNPPQSKHKPSSEQGCIIFVKLWQFQPDDRQHVNILMDNADISSSPANDKVIERRLYEDAHETVSFVTLSENAFWQSHSSTGNEILVLDGSVMSDQTTLTKHSWLRIPPGDNLQLKAGERGAKFWLKTGNLPDVENQISRVNNVS